MQLKRRRKGRSAEDHTLAEMTRKGARVREEIKKS
jgi:hypothetical protein